MAGRPEDFERTTARGKEAANAPAAFADLRHHLTPAVDRDDTPAAAASGSQEGPSAPHYPFRLRWCWQ